LGFDPRTEIRTFADLARFPAIADEWRSVPASDLIPRGCPGPFAVWETGGTTGAPRRIVDGHERTAGLARISEILNLHGFPPPGSGDWLHVGPSGPHLVGTNVARLARMRDALCHYVDLDPRWVKLLYQAGRTDEAQRYTAHVIDQTLHVLRTQPVGVLAVTPPLLQALCEHAEACTLLEARIKGVIWFGTSLSDESLRLLEEEFLPGARLVGWYGNTLAGVACQRPRHPDDPYRCIFTPPSPGAVYQVVDPADPTRQVGYGESGQVRLSVLNREIFLPWQLERDRAVRVLPADPTGWDGLARIAPLTGGGASVEGVY
ncbi:MAG: hypothetical protein JWN15_2303, partial [Firmicutes bacterium]|nr:hypothetical protein [Bacillota bacterium]